MQGVILREYRGRDEEGALLAQKHMIGVDGLRAQCQPFHIAICWRQTNRTFAGG